MPGLPAYAADLEHYHAIHHGNDTQHVPRFLHRGHNFSKYYSGRLHEWLASDIGVKMPFAAQFWEVGQRYKGPVLCKALVQAPTHLCLNKS